MKKFVIKADGSKQIFQREKIIRTCIRLGAKKRTAEEVAERIENEIPKEVSTSIILDLIYKHLQELMPILKHVVDLRYSISRLRSKPEFETFVRLVLEEYGYIVYPNQILQGKCVEHEVDGVAVNNEGSHLLEIKHHEKYHTMVGLDVIRNARATFEDILDGFYEGLSSIEPVGYIVVCNTKFSLHARRYAECRNIRLIGWRQPKDFGLERMIEEKKIYPITMLKAFEVSEIYKLGAAGIVTLKQFVNYSPKNLIDILGASQERINRLLSLANRILKET
ncbi:MAG: ATP cone domain-containing protein [Candidatus Njordarchaeales archaeon]